ncbi:hypothetical protein B0T24DRAFT_643787 [Lasiosphaeria ovina]|uniref:Uncharacterized protein n=1 Tax=Lasiosphaeria ovina TaxID=92902 RepID=A0AAE0JT84_9PEZI|nr:hypothetical protein B0T24DRAFT_643787 [Lasiosphaeria ovina]
MALDPGTILSAIEVVQRAIAIYHRVDELPSQMKHLGRRMERMNLFLVRFEAFVTNRPDTAYAALFSGQKDELAGVLESINGHAATAHDLFDRYEKGILSRTHDLQFRIKWATQLWFALVDSTPEKIQAVMDDIEFDRLLLSDYLGLMNAQGVEILVNNVKLQPQTGDDAGTEKDKTKSNKEEKHNSKKDKKGANANKDNEKQPTSPLAVVSKRPSPSPSPSPMPPRRDYKILFVDPYNLGRSVVAEALMKLLGQLTLRGNGSWRISEIHSAGFFTKNQSNCVDVIEGLDYSYESFNLGVRERNEAPEAAALAAVFDNNMYEYPFKKTIRDALAGRSTHGLRQDMFRHYDFIIVFTSREHDNVIKLKEALHRGGGASLSQLPRGKGRVLHLGAFVARDGGRPREIVTPPKNPDSAAFRHDWNVKVAQIKTAIKRFLEQEMAWQRPDKKAL